MDEEVMQFARLFTSFVGRMSEAAAVGEGSRIRQLLDSHLNADSSKLPVVSETFPSHDHVNVQLAVSTYLGAEGRSHQLVGITGPARHHSSLSDLLEVSPHWRVAIGSVDFANLPTGPDDTLNCVQYGLFLIEDHGSNLAVLMRGPAERQGQAGVSIEILGASQEKAASFLAEIRRLMIDLNVFRGKVISFEAPLVTMGRPGLGPLTFHRRPELAKDQLVLPEGVLEVIERELLAVPKYRSLLVEGGQHVKRGLLLYGPPGNGKTLTIRYLLSRLREHTVILLTGAGLGAIEAAASLARTLEPAIVVLEDVDLVAAERTAYDSNPVLFSVLNELDGIAEDADVAFVLTTNRADLLEPALAARPGRVDLAVEIGVPDDDGRRRLIELYGRHLELQIRDLERVLGRTRGVAASFMKELVRKAALLAAQDCDGSRGLTVTDVQLNAALDELLSEQSALTRVLLGGSPQRPPHLSRSAGFLSER